MCQNSIDSAIRISKSGYRACGAAHWPLTTITPTIAQDNPFRIFMGFDSHEEIAWDVRDIRLRLTPCHAPCALWFPLANEPVGDCFGARARDHLR